MAVTSAYTLEEARNMLNLWKDCEKSLVSGQATSYKVGSRECTLIDLDDIRSAIEFFSNLVDALSGTVRTKRVMRIVPRDL